MLQQPNAFIFAGENASGKSTYITHLLNNNIIFGEYINPDIILRYEFSSSRASSIMRKYTKCFKYI